MDTSLEPPPPMEAAPSKRYAELLFLVDVIFGLYVLAWIVLTTVTWLQGKAEARAVVPFVLLFMLNQSLSIVSRRVVRMRFQVELLRCFGLNGVLSSLAYLWVKGPLAPCWHVYVLLVIGFAPIFVGLRYDFVRWTYAYTAFQALNLVAATAFGVDDPNWFQVGTYVASIGVTGVAVTRFVAYLHASLRSESRKTMDLRAAYRKVKESERKLRESQDRLNLAFEAVRMAFWGVCMRTRRVQWSEALERLYGLSAEEDGHVALDRVLNVIHPDDHGRLDEAVAQALRDGEDYHVEFRIPRKEGTGYDWLEGIGRPLRGSGGEIVRIDGVVMDITQRKEAERVVEEQRAKMISASKMAALGEMAGGIAHEINNPLAIINVNARAIEQFVDKEPIDRESVRKRLKEISRTVARAADIIKGLRAFSRDATEDPREQVPVRSLIDDTLSLTNERLRHHGVDLRVGPVAPDLEVPCRPVEISQVLLNLLNNAFDAVAESKERVIEIGVQEEESRVAITVADSGPGVPGAIREKIMQPFFTTKPIGKGTGLGLSVSQGIVTSHGGSLSLDSRASRTTFVLRLPKTRGAAARQA